MPDVSDTLRQLLNVFWLRPETALWREIDIRAMSDFEFVSPSMDFGCGDGIFSFVRAGGCFDLKFDAFRSMSGMDQFFNKADVFDAYDETLQPLITTRPPYQIDIGFDHKVNLLKKANTLGLYKELVHGDGNAKLPFGDNTFSSIFSNIVYWLDDPHFTLSEIARVLKPGGIACLMLPNATLPKFSFYSQLYLKNSDAKWKFLELLDRGRFSDNIRQAKSLEEWKVVFNRANLRVLSHGRHLAKMTIQAWDIGLRPLFPCLLEMANELPNDKLIRVKEKWINTLMAFVGPMAHLDKEEWGGDEPAFHCFRLMKNV